MIAIFIAIGTILFYFFIIKPRNYWKQRHVPTGHITPIFGEHYRNILGKDCSIEFAERIYNKVPEGRYTGIYLFQTPVLLLKSPELIKEICVKNFNNVLNRQALTPDCIEPLMSKNLLALKGQHWKDIRYMLSPSFTISKIKAIHLLLCDNASRTVQYFLEKNEDLIEVEVKDTFTRFTNDVIANTIYGLEINSFKNTENEFYLMGKDASDFSAPWKIFALLLHHLSSKVARTLKVKLYGHDTTDFYTNVVKQTIKLREEKNIQRSDVLGILMEERKKYGTDKNFNGDLKEKSAFKDEKPDDKFVERYLSDEDIAAHLFLFMLGGYDTTSTAICFMAYELALNPDIQKKLIEEIDEVRSENGKPSYEDIVNLSYMDMVLSETLRKWPSIAHTDRIVTTPFTIEPELPEEEPIHMREKDKVMISIFGLHRDPKHYENPECFDPERFSPENKKNINPYTYLPFGVGPRNCIGMRLALLEIKVLFFYLLSNFDIVRTEKTEVPLKFKRTMVTLTAENGFQLAFRRRHIVNK